MEKVHGSVSHILINFREETHGVVKSVCTCVHMCVSVPKTLMWVKVHRKEGAYGCR